MVTVCDPTAKASLPQSWRIIELHDVQETQIKTVPSAPRLDPVTPVLRTLAQALHIQKIAASPLLEPRLMAARRECTTRTTAAILSSFSSCGFGCGGGPSSRHLWQMHVVAPISGIPPSAFLAQQPGPTPELAQLHRQRHSTDINGSGSVISAVAAGGEGLRVEP